MIRPDEMPCPMGLPYRDGEPIVYDSGDFPGGMDKVLGAIGGLPRSARARVRRELRVAISVSV